MLVKLAHLLTRSSPEDRKAKAERKALNKKVRFILTASSRPCVPC